MTPPAPCDTSGVRVVDLSAARGRWIAAHGGAFTLVPIMAPDDAARTVVMHLGPGDTVGEHETATRQLMVVVRGSGWASGADGVRTSIAEDHGVLFEEGETHAAGTDTGMTVVVVEGTFSVA